MTAPGIAEGGPQTAADRRSAASRPSFAAAVLRFVTRPRFWRPLISLAIVLISWELLGRYVLTNKLFFVPLSDVIAATVDLARKGELQHHFAASFTRDFLRHAPRGGGRYRVRHPDRRSTTVADYTEAYLNALYSTPLVAVAPLLILWLGIGIASKIAVVFLISVFPIVISTASGVRNM